MRVLTVVRATRRMTRTRGLPRALITPLSRVFDHDSRPLTGADFQIAMYAGSVGLSSFRTTSRLPLHSASVVAIPGVHDIPCLNNRAKHMGISWLCRSSPALSNCKVGHAQIWLGRELYCRMASTASCGSNSEQLYRASTLSGISYLPLLTPLFGISCRLGRSFSRYLWYVAIADADGLPCREGGCSSGPREDLSVRALQIAQFSAISGIMRMSGRFRILCVDVVWEWRAVFTGRWRAMRCPTVYYSCALRHRGPIEKAAAVFARQGAWCSSQRSQCTMASHDPKLAGALGSVKCVTSGR